MEIKVVFLGDPCSGKTQLINVCCGSKFEEITLPTNYFYYIEKVVKINNIKYALLLCDTVGNEEFREFKKIIFKDSNFFILVYDITKKNTFDNIYYWYNEIQDLRKDAIIGVVGTHSDYFLIQEVKTEIAKKYADSIEAKFIEVSARVNKEPFNIKLIELAKDYIEKYGNKNNENQFIKYTLLKFYKY